MNTKDDSVLLRPLTPNQQLLVDLVAEAFLQADYEWPFYDFIEGTFDHRGADAWETLQSFPSVGRWGYSAVRWIRGAPSNPPTREAEIALTVIGIHHAPALRRHVTTYFKVLDYLASRRRGETPTPRAVRNTTATSEDFCNYWAASHGSTPPSPKLVHQLLEGEPPVLYGSRSAGTDRTSWEREVPRQALDFAGITDVSEYVDRLNPWLVQPEATVPALSTPSLPLALAIDYLDDVWQLVFGSRLFRLRGVERLAALASSPSTSEECHARLSVLSDLLRTTTPSSVKQTGKRTRDQTLGSMRATVVGRVGAEDDVRLESSFQTLEAVITLRDANEHTLAAHRTAGAASHLGIPYPVTDWVEAWTIASARTVEALNVIREELRSTVD